MLDKDNNVLDIEEFAYHADFMEASKIIQDWYNRKPTDEMRKLHKAFTNISLYVMSMQKRQRTYDKQLSEFRAAKLRAVERARKAEDKLNTIENA